jgi:hypothetical protein
MIKIDADPPGQKSAEDKMGIARENEEKIIMKEVQSVITRYIAAYNAKDVNGMMACLAPEVHFVNRSDGVVTVETRGRDAFRALAEQGVELFSERSQDIEQFIAADIGSTASWS